MKKLSINKAVLLKTFFAVLILSSFCALKSALVSEIAINAISGVILDQEGKPAANGLPIFFAGKKQILSGGVFRFPFDNFSVNKKIFILIGENLKWNFEGPTKNVDSISSLDDKNILLYSIESKDAESKDPKDKNTFLFKREEIKGYNALPKKRCLILTLDPAFVDTNKLSNVEISPTSNVITLPTIHLLPDSKSGKNLKSAVATSVLSTVEKPWLLHEPVAGQHKTIQKTSGYGHSSSFGNKVLIKA